MSKSVLRLIVLESKLSRMAKIREDIRLAVMHKAIILKALSNVLLDTIP
jgi:hypothetical protein